MQRSETVAIWKGARTQSVWEYTIDCAATRINRRPDGSFFYSVRRGGEGQPDGGPTRRQKADGRMPVPRSFNEGGFAQGNEAQRNQSLGRLPRFKPPEWRLYF